MPYVYLDSVRVRTVAWGHVVKPGESFLCTLCAGSGCPTCAASRTPAAIRRNGEPGTVCNLERGRALFMADSVWRCAAVTDMLKVPVTQNQFDALVSFSYNEGVAALGGSTLLRLLNGGDVQGAAEQFMQWTRAGNDPHRLLTRRQDERALFLRQDAQPEVG